MQTDPKIYGEEYVKGRIWSFIRFHSYLRKIASIFCEEFQYDKDDIVEVMIDEAVAILAGDIESMNQRQIEEQRVEKNN